MKKEAYISPLVLVIELAMGTIIAASDGWLDIEPFE